MERAAAAARAPRGGGVLDKLLRLLGIDAAAHDNKSAKRHAKSKPSPSPRSPPSSSLFFAPNKVCVRARACAVSGVRPNPPTRECPRSLDQRRLTIASGALVLAAGGPAAHQLERH